MISKNLKSLKTFYQLCRMQAFRKNENRRKTSNWKQILEKVTFMSTHEPDTQTNQVAMMPSLKLKS